MKYQIKNSNGTLSNVEVLERENDLIYVKEGNLYYWCKESELVKLEEKEPYQMTPKQYREYVIKQTMNRYKSCTRKKAELCHTEEQTNRKHLEILIEAIKEGKIIPNKVLDKLTKGQLYRLTHDYPVYFENNPYFDPEIRGKKLDPFYTVI